jgi:3-hydroxyacyl-CoA dehydrogenase
MSYSIKKAAVLGSGVMGSGIAAHIANAGIPVVLLDIVPPKAAEGEDTSSPAFRNKFAAGAVQKLFKTKPSPIHTAQVADLITVGNLEDDLGLLADVDWVCEAVLERLDVKQALFEKLEKTVRPDTIVSSNTSGLRIQDMLAGRGEAFRKHFLVTHFFNPVRYMKLLELVAGEETDPAILSFMHGFSEEVLGKGVVFGKDTTNFVANRIGVYGFMKTFEEMLKSELSVEEVDKILGPATGRPKTAVFRTADLVGVDLFIHVAQNCYDSLTEDEERDIFQVPEFAKQLVAKGWLGNKSGHGFYKRDKRADGSSVVLSLDINSMEYVEPKEVRFASLGAARKIEDPAKRAAAVMKGDDKAAKFAANVSFATWAYSSRRIPEIADDLVNIDRGMRWGFGWDVGPFETWDAYGVAEGLAALEAAGYQAAPWVKEMLDAGRTSFYAQDGAVTTYWDIASKSAKPVPEHDKALSVSILRRTGSPVERNAGASLWDMGDGIALLEFHTKMNAIDQDVAKMMKTAVDVAERDFRGLVIGNDAQNFCVGANIAMIMFAAQAKAWDQIDALVADLQGTMQRMRYSWIPVVTAPTGLTLGGGAETAMSGNAIQAASELYIGLVEVGVGLIPGASGNLQLLRNVYGDYAMDKAFDPFPFIQKVFMSIGMAKVATSAEEGRDMGFLKATDGISMNRDFVLADAKARAIGMAEAGFRPPRQGKFLLPGPSGKATIDMLLYDMALMGQVSAHDKLIGSKLAGVLTGGDTTPTTPVTEERILELEREAFLSLCGEPKTMERIGAMLTTGKPLRN